jgi:hypothetical protein
MGGICILIFIFQTMIYIEYDGLYHFKDSLYGTFDTVHTKDKYKNNFITKNNLYLLRIHYKDIKLIKNLLNTYIQKRLPTNIIYSRSLYYFATCPNCGDILKTW